MESDSKVNFGEKVNGEEMSMSDMIPVSVECSTRANANREWKLFQ